MGKFIIQLKDMYLEWSTVVDAPTTFGMTLDDFRQYYQQMYGSDGMRDLDSRLARVAEHGSSAIPPCYWMPNLISANRAGPDESCLTIKEIYRAYCLRKPIRKGWIVPGARDDGIMKWAT